ncbi:NAD(P)-binding protein [Rhypophila sp. PSN 637]
MESRRKFVLVTGCGQGGIGEALVKDYARRGLHPIATVLPSESRQHLVDQDVDVFSLDVTLEDSVMDLRKHVEEVTGGHLDILVNNAGIAYTMSAIDTDVRQVEAMFRVNVFGPMRMVRHFHDMLIASAGTVVNIGSIGGIVPYVYGSSYNASKAALHHWSNTLRVEMAPLGVRVLTIISGEVGTNILKSDTTREIPKESFYAPLAVEFRQHVTRVPDTMDRFVYSKAVTEQSLTRSPPAWFWYGKSALLVWLLDTFTWRSIWDGMFTRMFNLQKLRR